MRSPEVGAAGVRQLSPDGTLHPTIRLFPTPLRVLGEALAGERLPFGRLRQRVLDAGSYERETPCDWTSGSFVLVRREALESAGIWDERFFIYSEEVDLCKRIRDAGWQILHVPSLTIVHHVGKGVRARTAHVRTAQQNAFGLVQYAEKHFTPARRAAFLGALTAYYGLRALPRPGGDGDARAAARRALSVLAGRHGSPYMPPPATALEPGAVVALEPERR